MQMMCIFNQKNLKKNEFGYFRLSFIGRFTITNEELVSKTSYIHFDMLLICSSGSQQRVQFSTQNSLQMENVDTNWNLEKKISANSNSTTVWTAFWPCHKIYIYTAKLLFHQSFARHSDYHCDNVVTVL